MPVISQDTSVSRPGSSTPFRLSDYHYELPAELIAQAPLANRSDSRLLVLDHPSLHHSHVSQLAHWLQPGDHLVFNNTRVIPARLGGQKASGGKIELMLERVVDDGRVLAKIRASKSPRPGALIHLHGALKEAGSADEPAEFICRVVGRSDDLFELEAASGAHNELALFIEQHGQIPLPPYIDRAPDAADEERYQTVYAQKPGAVAAPTAGLHFDQALFDALRSAGITHSFITLHVGAGTFQPVRVDNPAEHVMHAERVSVGADTVEAIARTRQRGGRVIAVGTTSVRALEASAQANDGVLQPYSGETRLFLTPGSPFHVVDGIFTNFHLPESTLLMLIAAFAGLDETLKAYQQAVAQRYRFFSYGDAMLVWPRAGVRE